MDKLNKFLYVFILGTLLGVGVNYLIDSFVYHEAINPLSIVRSSVVVALMIALVFVFFVKKKDEAEK